MSAPNLDLILNGLDKVRKSGSGWVACCPAHDDKNPSLSISEGRQGVVLVNCRSGCAQADVIQALRDRGLWGSAPRGDRPRPAPRPRDTEPDPEDSRRMQQAAAKYEAAGAVTDFPDLIAYLEGRYLDPALVIGAGARAARIPRARLDEDKTPPGWIAGEMADALIYPIYHPDDICKPGEKRIIGIQREWPWGRPGGPRSVKAAIGKTHAPNKAGAGGFLIGTLSRGVLIDICEGQLTGHAIADATHGPVLVLFTAGGLADIGAGTVRNLAALEVRARIAGDTDPSGAGERGAESCARKIKIIAPQMPVTISLQEGEKVDWLDVLAEHGPETTARLLTERERAPAVAQPENKGTYTQDQGQGGEVDMSKNTRSHEIKEDESEDETPSPEVVYHSLAGQDADLASFEGVLYRWTGSYWAAQDARDEESRAFSWLKIHYPSRANPRLAISCVAAAVMGAQRLPGQAASQNVVLPLKNGYLHIDIEKGTVSLKIPDKSLGMTYAINTAFDHDAEAPLFHTFLEQVFYMDKETQGWVQEYAGHTLMGDCRFQTAAFFLGTGANGKSTFTEIMAALHKKVVSAQLNALSGFNLSSLLGASLVVVDETPSRIDEQALKSLISGGLCQVDRKFRDPIAFRPTAKWIILGNIVPSISDQSHGFWRRVPVVQFKRQFTPDQQDPMLAAKIIGNEMAGVLNWAVAGLVRLIQRGRFPNPSDAMVRAQLACQVESNSVLAWWSDDRAEVNVDFETPRSVIYTDYKTWCHDNGMAPCGAEKFWNKLEKIAGGEGTEARVRKINGQTVRVVSMRLLTPGSTVSGSMNSSSPKVIKGRW